MTASTTYFYAAVGEVLTTYSMDVDAATLSQAGSVSLPAGVQYAWQHPHKRILYVVSSDGGPGRDGTENHASAFTIDAATGALLPLGSPQSLGARPIHCTVDQAGEFLLVAFNRPSGLAVVRIEADGSLGPACDQDLSLNFGIYAHQVRVLPSGRAVVVPVRGDDETEDSPADTGALMVFGLDQAGHLEQGPTLSPMAGYGPRHLDVHPSSRWLYVSVERQNRLQMYEIDADGSTLTGPHYDIDSLSAPRRERVRQIASAIRIHPNGRFVYQANRSDRFHDVNGWTVGYIGEDSIAVHTIDPASGEPHTIAHTQVDGIHIRTLSVDPSGRLLIASTIAPVPVQKPDGGIELVPAKMMLYRIANDGQLSPERSYDVYTGSKQMFWTGMVTVA